MTSPNLSEHAAGTVVVLAGGLSHERDVSLQSGRQVSRALRSLGVDVIESDVDSALVGSLVDLGRPVVFPVLHGETGEDGALREVLELLDVPFVGSTGSACRVAFDKSIATTVVADAKIRTPAQVALPHEIFRELGAATLVRALADRIGFPMIVKPSRSGSALGCTKVARAEDLPAAMVAAYAYGQVAVVEEFISGTEVTVAVVDRGPSFSHGPGPVALPVVEIRPDSGIYDYTARYTPGSTRFLCPAELDDDVTEACSELALAVHRVLGLRDISRTDIIVPTRNGVVDGPPVFLETNVAPGMTPTSAVPLACEAYGWSVGTMCADLVAAAAARAGRPDPRQR